MPSPPDSPERSAPDRETWASPPVWIAGGLFAICALPGLLMVAGFELGTHSEPLDLAALSAPDAGVQPLYKAVRGGIIHALMEWSGVAAAAFTVILAMAHYRLRGEAVTMIIALALFWSGCMDAFHALAATQLLTSTADSQNFVPFTWAISRLFNVLIILLGVGLLMVRSSLPVLEGRRYAIPIIGLVFGLIAYVIIHACSTASHLPQTMYPDALITRPWDFIPLVLFVIAGLIVFPLFHRRFRSPFSMALWLSAIPEIATEMHMAFGSTALFDAHFHAAHLLKIVAYLVPLGGLVLEYIESHHNLEMVNVRLREVQSELQVQAKRIEAKANELSAVNTELQQFVYVASHDLRAPLRAVSSLSSWIAEDLDEHLTGDSREHMDLLRQRVSR
ncbi:MAG: MASE3 domain-containing protein, partial [Myxococcota bacterium]